jgi:YVTN family beta-propeller protein
MRILVAVSAGAVITLLAPGLASANPPAAAPRWPAATAYVAEGDPGGDSAAVIPIPAATGQPGTPIKVHVSADPALLAATPDGKTVYLVDERSGTVIPIDTATSTAGAPIPVGPPPAPSRSRRTARPRTC